MQKIKLVISDMDCPSCAKTIEKNMPDSGAILSVQVNFAAKTAFIEFNENKTNVEQIIKKINRLGYTVESKRQEEKQDIYYYIVFSILPLLIIIQQIVTYNLPHEHKISGFPIAALAILFAYRTFKKAFSSLKNGNITAELYMSIGIIVTFFMKEFIPSAVIVFYQNAGEFLDKITSRQASSAIEDLVKISPQKARVIKGDAETEVAAEEVNKDDIVLVKTGEKIPIDGVVIEGSGFVNQSAITGEAIAQEKITGSEVFAGTILEGGYLLVKASTTYQDTVFHKIITLIEEAEKQKSNIQKIADKFASYFLPVLLFIAVITYLVTKNMNTAVSVIIVSCPCAIAIATPLAIMASAGKLAKYGIIIKGGLSLEVISKVKTLIMDKTGTITLGEPIVVSIKGFGCHDDNEIISYAASCEIYSEHHLAKAIIKKAKDLNLKILPPDKFNVVPGKGITAELNGKKILMGNKFLMDKISISFPAVDYINQIEGAGQTSILIAHNDELCGVIGIEDKIREEVKEALLNLRKAGIKDLLIVTGDNKLAAQGLAKKLNIDKIFYEQLPEDKVNIVKGLQKDKQVVAFVGDGINDTPALKTADLSIAMGIAGTHVAIETADIILMNDNLLLLPLAIKQGKRTANAIKQNIFFGLIFNIIGVTAACMGMLPPVWAAMAHIVPDIFVFSNSARLIK